MLGFPRPGKALLRRCNSPLPPHEKLDCASGCGTGCSISREEEENVKLEFLPRTLGSGFSLSNPILLETGPPSPSGP